MRRPQLVLLPLALLLSLPAQNEAGAEPEQPVATGPDAEVKVEVAAESEAAEQNAHADLRLQDIVPAPVKDWPRPQIPADWPLPGFDLEVTAASPEAAAHVVAGIHYLHLFWDQEALRYFAAALQLDPDCPLAWWGVAMSLLPQNNEFFDQRNLALERLPQLRGQVAHPWEAELIDSLLVIPRQGAMGAINELDQLLALKPGDLNATLLKLNFLRDGHVLDRPLPGLARAQELVTGLLQEHGDHPLVLHYALRLHYPAPLDRLDRAALVLDRLSLPLGSPYLYYEAAQVGWMLGRHEDARRLAALGRRQAEAWLEETSADLADCPTLIDLAELEVLSLLELGRADEARELADSIAVCEVAAGRNHSAGAQALAHRGVLLPALVEERFDAWDAALDALPPPPAEFSIEELAPWAWEARRLFYRGQMAAEAGDLAGLREAHGQLGQLGAGYQELAPEAIEAGIRLRWHRQQRVMEQLSQQHMARIAELQHDSETTYRHLRAAIEALERADYEAPPVTVHDPHALLGEAALRFGHAELARRAFDQSLSGPATEQATGWLGLAESFQGLGDSRRAAAALQRFEDRWADADGDSERLAPWFERAEALREALEE